MPGLLDNAEIGIPCPACGCKTKKSIGWIKNNSEFICACGGKVRLDTNQFKTEIASVDAAIRRLQNTIKKLNK